MYSNANIISNDSDPSPHSILKTNTQAFHHTHTHTHTHTHIYIYGH